MQYVKEFMYAQLKQSFIFEEIKKTWRRRNFIFNKDFIDFCFFISLKIKIKKRILKF